MVFIPRRHRLSLQSLVRLLQLFPQRRRLARQRLSERRQLALVILHLPVHLIPPLLKFALQRVHAVQHFLSSLLVLLRRHARDG